ncbi:hypothetical protein Trydic_g3071 [Trypoxylus dichotomus]
MHFIKRRPGQRTIQMEREARTDSVMYQKTSKRRSMERDLGRVEMGWERKDIEKPTCVVISIVEKGKKEFTTKAMQFVTGHIYFKAYYRGFKLKGRHVRM